MATYLTSKEIIYDLILVLLLLLLLRKIPRASIDYICIKLNLVKTVSLNDKYLMKGKCACYYIQH